MAKKKKVMTKSALFTELAERTGLKKTEITKVLETIAEIAYEQLAPKSAGVFTLPGLARMKIREVKAVKGGEKKINPLTKTEYITKDRPKQNKVRILPVKSFAESLK